MTKQLGIGDPVEVKTLVRTPFARGARVVWLPATVTHADRSKIGVAFSDGARMELPVPGRSQWRRVR